MPSNSMTHPCKADHPTLTQPATKQYATSAAKTEDETGDKMRHEFTDEQLQLTILDASDQRSIFIRTARELEDIDSSAIQSLRTLLYHLPEPEHDPTLLQGYRSFTRLRRHPIFKGEYKKAGDLTDLLMGRLDRLERLDHLEASKGSQHQADDWQQCRFEDIQKGDRVKRIFTKVSGSKITKEGVAEHLVDGSIWSTSCGMRLASNNYVPHETGLVTLYRIPAPVTHPDPEEHPVIVIYRPNGNGKTPVSYAWTGQHYRSFDGQEYFSANEITDWSPAKVVANND